jgi:hypothetical protein
MMLFNCSASIASACSSGGAAGMPMPNTTIVSGKIINGLMHRILIRAIVRII